RGADPGRRVSAARDHAGGAGRRDAGRRPGGPPLRPGDGAGRGSGPQAHGAPRPHVPLGAEGGLQARAAQARAGIGTGRTTMSAVHEIGCPVDEQPPRDGATLEGFVFDLDGTLLLSDRSLGGYEVLPGAIEVLTVLRQRSVPFVVLTNGSAYPPARQAARLRGIGLPVDDEQMLTPSSVTAAH